MITEVVNFLFSLWRRGVRISMVLTGILAGWIGLMAGIMWLSEIAPASIVVVSNTSILTSLPPDVKILRSGKHRLILTSDRSGYVKDLYSAGAWLVLPSLRNGCLIISGASKKSS